MVQAKFSIMVFLCLGFALAGCGGPDTSATDQQRVTLEKQKSLPQSLNMALGTYTASVSCADSAQSEKLKSLQWTLTLKEDGNYISSQQNLATTCTENCSEITTGTLKTTEVQAVFTATKVLNTTNNVFESSQTPATKTYFVMNYDRTKGALVLIDTDKTNPCGGKMILTLQK